MTDTATTTPAAPANSAQHHSADDHHGGDHHGDGHHAPAPRLDEVFDNETISQFEAEDIKAGRAIGKLLCSLFIYTIIAMSIVGAWTWFQVMR